ncbi:FkbM family methyltransferase [Halorubrum lacusprofundi]|uniref:FkbM family methyltransferase n=1 Tax=Halorubrum lacusprofundi TaxID=2247 RepID=UPI0009AD564D
MYYDIGANVGVYTCFAGQHADRVVAFEPHEGTATRLRENVDLNDIDVTVYQTAVADYEGTASLAHPRRSPQELGRVAKRSRLCRWYSQLRGHS